MRKIKMIFSILLMATLMFCSCSAAPSNYGTEALTEKQIASKQTRAMQEGHVYIHDGKKLHDLMKLNFRDPMATIEAGTSGYQSVLASIQKSPRSFIISFTVAGYSEQINHGEINSMDYHDYELHTFLRIDEIHYQGENVSLNVGDTYDFYHVSAWITQEDGEYMYSIYPRDIAWYGVFRYGHQYIMSGYYNEEENRLYVNNALWWNEICSDEEAQSFQEQFPKMASSYVTSADQVFEPGFRDE